jgi:hypothetical protein
MPAARDPAVGRVTATGGRQRPEERCACAAGGYRVISLFVVARLRSTDDVQLIVCADARFDAHPFLTLPVPIRVPSLTVRTDELPRIVDDYAIDAVAELRPLRAGFAAADREWVLQNAPMTLAEIEKGTLRLVAIHASRNISDAAARLGIAPVSLARWIGRRKLPPMQAAT